MGEYNPHAPYVLGHEWVPIKQANYVPDNATERGYTFRIEHAVTPVSGIYYISDVPQNPVAQSVDFISVYRRGEADRTGPIKTLHIPASAVATSDAAAVDITAGFNALLNPNDNNYIIFSPQTGGGSSTLRVNFDTAAYSQQLFGKRIIDFRVRYQIWGFHPDYVQSNLNVHINQFNLSNSEVGYGDVAVVVATTAPAALGVTSFTDMNPFWNTAFPANNQRDVVPWRYPEINRFRSGVSPANDQLVVEIINFMDTAVDPDAFGLMGFMDLEVVYCEENRLLYGGRRTPNIALGGSQSVDFYAPGSSVVRLFSPSLAAGAVLTPGDYTVALIHRNMEPRSIYNGAPEIYATRQYYEIPLLNGVQINQSTVDDTNFTVEDDSVITHITLHTATTIVTGVHAYGTSVGAPVYGNITAIQEIEDNPSSGTGVQYPQVRFYARRFADTTVPLTLVDDATGVNTVSISVADFDALDEIVDGWREVTLRFATPPTFPVTAGAPDWRWQATGESAGNQWQVLASSGPSIASPTAFSTALTTGPATYWAPLGSSVTLTWQSPTVSGTASDRASDAILIFSQDPPAVTGFAITQLTQAVTGVGSGAFSACGHAAACIPAGIFYHRLTWNPFGICDSFGVDAVDAWPPADTGQTYTLSGGTNPGNYDVNNGSGKHTLTTTAVARNSLVSVSPPLTLTTAQVDVSVSEIATGDSIIAGPAIGIDADNMYQARLQFRTAGGLTLEIIKRLAAAQASLASVVVGGYVANSPWTVELKWLQPNKLEARAWQVGTTRPAAAQLVTFDGAASTVTTFTSVILRSVLNAGNTNVNPVVSFDNLISTTAQLSAGSLEIQRRDAVTTDWQTVMLTESPGCVIQFNDFEARVGVLSEYRMRTLNALDFAGPWVTGSGTITSPGVVMANSGSANSVLMFTTNEESASNLAYVMQWEGAPVEEFLFPEVETLALQRMFGRDFAIAFHPLERGGDRFNRTILVNAAAIALPSLANFRGLRDLAWADLDYVCVRDELGNRWFATVIVPSGDVRSDRTIYLARITVSEATDTASPVDPAS